MGLFSKSKCSTCMMCNCCCATDGVNISTRTYTYDGSYDWENSFAESDYLSVPTERIVLKNDDEQMNLFYHQIDTEFYARNIHEDLPLASYANGAFFKKLGDPSDTSKYSLPVVSYVADAVYVRKTNKGKAGGCSCFPGKCCCCCCKN